MKKVYIFYFIFFAGFSLNSYSQNVKKLIRNGNDLLMQKKFTEAVEQFTQVLEIQPDNIDAFTQRANAYEKLGELDKAVQDLDKAVALNEKDYFSFFKAGRIYYAIGEYESALDRLKSAVNIRKNYTEALSLKIDVQLHLKQYSSALSDAKTLLRYKENAVNFYKYGLINELSGNFPDALKAYKNAISKSHSFFEAYTSLADLQRRMKNLPQALQNANTAIQINPEFIKAYKVRSLIFSGQMKYPEAINDISTAIMLNPDNEDAYFQRAIYYQNFTQHPYAINDFSKVISINPDRYDAYFKRAYSFEQIMNFKEASNDYNIIIRNGITDTVAASLKAQAEKRIFEINKETNKPVINITYQKEKPQNVLLVPKNKDSISINGTIEDQSPIKFLKINNTEIPVIKKDDLFIFEADITLNSDEISIEASDIYNNLETVNYKIKRTEIDPPKVKIIAPYASDDNIIFLDTIDSNIFIEGIISDESQIVSIFIDDVIASYIPQDINPSFLANINIINKDKITVRAEDKFGNVSETIFFLNREGTLFSDNIQMGKKWIVFIENSKYRNLTSLEGPVKDVELVKSALSKYIFHNFIHKIDMTKQDLERFFAIELRDLLKSNRVNSLIIWYSGHGKYVNETSYWIPVDAKKDDEFTYYNINALHASMQSYPTTVIHTLVIMDACESGPGFFKAMSSDTQNIDCNDPVFSKRKSAQVFSSGGYKLAADESQFTRTFTNVLINNQDTCLPIEKIVEKVTVEVVSNNQQKPQFGRITGLEDEGGSFFFILK